MSISGAPYIAIYKVDKTTDTFTKLTNPSTTPTGATPGSTGVSFSFDSTYMAIAHSTTPFLTIYKIDKTTDIFTKLTNPGTMPSNAGTSSAFSNDGNYLAVTYGSTPYVIIYKIDKATDTFTKLTNPSTLPVGAASSATFSNDGNYLVIGHATTPFITIYRINSSTDTFTKIANPSPLPTSGSQSNQAFSGDSTYFAQTNGGSASSFVQMFKVDSTTDTFTYLSDVITQPGAYPNGCIFISAP